MKYSIFNPKYNIGKIKVRMVNKKLSNNTQDISKVRTILRFYFNKKKKNISNFQIQGGKIFKNIFVVIFMIPL